MTWSEPDPRWLENIDRWTKSNRWAVDALITLAFAAVLGSLSLSGAHGIHWSTGWATALFACFAVVHLTVAIRVRAPSIAFGLASVAMLVIVLAPDGRVADPVSGGPTHVPALFLPSSLVFLVALYSVAAHLSVVRSRIALAVALVGALIATGSTTDTFRQLTAGGWLVGFYVGVAFVMTVIMTWNVGRLALLRRQRAIGERAESARLAVLEERARIAREMHDIVAHSLAVIVRQAEGGAFVAERDPERAGQTLQTIADAGRGALTDMRGLLGVLHDPTAAHGAEPQPGLADLPRLICGVRDTGLDAELTGSGAPFSVSAATELAVYRLVQEGLTNAVKYAGPQAHVAVSLRWQPGMLTVDVADDGGGPAPLPVPGAGAGLAGLRDRVAAVGGTLSVMPLDRGFHLRACLSATMQSGRQ